MKKYDFGEKTKEYSAKAQGEVEVWQSPKYLKAKQEVIKILESEKYKDVLDESDFWILMNATKNGKMAYTGLIISHNGCLKINDTLDEQLKFKPECVSIDKDGYSDSLVFTYVNEPQGLYEVGEVSLKNCKNDYPYAMALKRCFDRVVLKNCKLAYAGVYSDSEAEEFTERIENNTENDESKKFIPATETQKNAIKKLYSSEEDINILKAKLNEYGFKKIDELDIHQASSLIQIKKEV